MLAFFSLQRARRIGLLLVCAVGLLGIAVLPTLAQTPEPLQLAVHRIFGYGGGEQIQGLFGLEPVGPVSITSATFKIDNRLIAEVKSAPFQVRLNTDNYPLGLHSLTVTVQTADGQTLTSAPLTYEFVAASIGYQAGLNIALRIIFVVFGLMAVVFALQMLSSFFGKRKTLPLGAPRNYELKGGAICPKCHRPFALHLLSMNVLTGYVDRCDHCGKWSFVRRASREQLAAAERAELAQAAPETPIAEETAEAKLKRQMDESRYQDKG